MAVKQSWRTDPRTRNATYRMEVEVNKELLMVEHVVTDACSMSGHAPPLYYVERQMRAQLMQAIERKLFGLLL